MIFFKYLFKMLLLPPGLIMTGILAGLLIMRRWRRAGIMVVLLFVVMLMVFSLPVVAALLYRPLLQYAALDPAANLEQADAIVVLTGGMNPMAPEYGKDIASTASVQRARYAAFIHRRTGKPILIAGGSPKNTAISEAEAARQLLEDEMHTPVRWLDQQSKDTEDSAANVMKMLSGENIKNIILITSEYHMRRADLHFKKAGFKVIPAPVGISGKQPVTIYDFYPSAGALAKTEFVLNEWYGIWWRSLKNLAAAALAP